MTVQLPARLLIANRGEIACRIARTAHRMGIGTVGVYSEPDAAALHVDAVDRAVALGGVTPAESYLRAEALVRAALDTGCDAVHPGYGFLAENSGFAEMVVAAGLVWVGPPADQIALLGDKMAAKRLAREAGVAGGSFFEAAPDALPDDVPMPVLVKAAAGGGGRGMRIVRSHDELADAVAAAAREAAAAFGDGRVFVEPFIERGRHVEVQIVGDQHGAVIHLGDRECSIQRRHQKIIEEAPSPGVAADTRATLWEGALALAHLVGYENAGTVEFLVGEDGTIDFLEVNTRLQVEHPVTEAITGLDLVELQLRVAAGERLPLSQDDVRLEGHAIEARVVAEDPAAGWLPGVGAITAFGIDDAIRVDTGVRVGSTVSPDYDSLLAKAVAHAPTRSEAAATLRRALRGAHLAGPATNRDTLVAVFGHGAFADGTTLTSFFADHPEVLAPPGPDPETRTALAAAAAAHAMCEGRESGDPWRFAPPGWRNLPTVGQRATWRDTHGGTVQLEEWWESAAAATMAVGPWPVPDADGALGEDERARVSVRLLDIAPDRIAIEVDGVRTNVALAGSPATGLTTTSPAGALTWTREPRFVDHASDEAGSGPVAPLPGTVTAVLVETGTTVAEGDVIVVVEAMKMEHKIVATGVAHVVEILVAPGDRVEAGDLLVRLEPVG